MVAFEYPFNERIRTLLRLEDLFTQFSKNSSSKQSHHHHNAMLTLFQIMDVMDRGELKNDLMQELEKQRALLIFFRANPNIDSEKLDLTLDQINQAIEQLRNLSNKPVLELKQNDWLMNIKQRAVIPGGLCEFDLPSYHFWLHTPDNQRQDDIDNWIKPLWPIYQAIQIILQLLRSSAEKQAIIAQNGNYQQMLNTAKPSQMLRIELAEGSACYPEVSANKYAIHIRFVNINAQRQVSACQTDIAFELTLAS